ncbi:hypothetical protein [Xanthomonas sp. MUS 060]|uniref:hypothetical protein n=1 Tax=Xanthomonas sp. MUS 060 TaxID=1588031 RepID=UPI000A573EB2|nr:hypothetical protein [Xanthomonas sp. MUS 060]
MRELYTIDEIEERIASHDYGAELMLQHAMVHLRALRDAQRDAERYQHLRRHQHWSVIDSLGGDLCGDVLDAAIDAEIAKGAQG